MYRDIESEPLPFFLSQVQAQKLSGHLYVTARDFHISLHFLNGMLANGSSTRRDEKLSVILQQMGTISAEQRDFLDSQAAASDDQVAGILVDRGFAKKKDIFYARVFQLRRIAISVFQLRRGMWIFTAGEPDPPLREVFEIPLASILVEGARSLDQVAAYASRWQDCVPQPFREIPLDSEMYFTDPERELFAALQGQEQACRRLPALLRVKPVDFWRSLLAFHLLGIVVLPPGCAEAAAGPAPAIEAEPAPPAASPPRRDETREVPPAGEWLAAAATDEGEFLLTEEMISEAPLQPEPAPPPPRPYGPDVEIVMEIDGEFAAKPPPPAEPPPPPPAVPATAPPPREFAPVAAPPATTLSDGDHERAWDLLLQAKESYERRDFAGALPLLRKAIKLEPGQGDFYYLLGLCQTNSEVLQNEAEINLKKAIELKSWSADPVYALGVLYRRQGKMKLAERCFQRVKEIAYEHTGASRALIDLRRQKAGPPAKKKRF